MLNYIEREFAEFMVNIFRINPSITGVYLLVFVN